MICSCLLFESATQNYVLDLLKAPLVFALQCGSCYAYSTTAAIEAIHVIKTGFSNRTDLSEAQVVECSTNFHCDGGWMPRAYQYAQVGPLHLYIVLLCEG